MASAIHAAQPQYNTPLFSRDRTGSSAGTLPFTQTSINGIFEGQPFSATPTETPPPSRGHQMPLDIGAYRPTNGMQMQQGTPRGLAEINGHMMQQQYPPGHKPQIYTAVYSGVSVYEMDVNNIAVMRRRSDSWLNATQILKVAGIDKGKRTKVLEKEILAGEHEKVQGGYGKYQGTWINYRRGREFCRQYGVEELLRPLLEYDMGQDGVTLAGQGGVETPTKEQAMAAQRKKNMYNGGIENRPPAQSPSGTFFKSISSTAANAVNAINKARFETPGPRPASGNKRPASARRSSQQVTSSQESAFAGSSQQSMQSIHSDGSFGINGQLEPAFGTHATPYFTKTQHQGSIHDSQEPPRKRFRLSTNEEGFPQDINGGYDVSMEDGTPTEPNESFLYHQRGLPEPILDSTVIGVQPLPQPTTATAREKQQLLMSLFLDSSQADFSNHEALMRLSGEDLDIPIDATAHTALHWAATLARTSLVRVLIAKGASIYRVNGGGETPLMRAALTTNNLDQGCFPELLELLGPTIEMRDGRGRTVLHHIAVSSAIKGRSPSCKYYLECLLEFVVRQGSASSSQQDSFNGMPGPSQTKPKSISLARFMSEIVNATDMSGDTALNLAARIGNQSIIQQLIEVGANPSIPNRGGLKPIDFGIGGDPEPTEVFQSSQASVQPLEKTSVSKVGDSSRNLMTSISSLLSDTESNFRSELQTKQSLIDQTHSRLRETTSLLADERRQLEDLQRKADERQALKQQLANLRRANDEQKALLSQRRNSNGTGGQGQIRMDVKIGDADAGLEIDPALLPPLPPSPSQPLHISPQQHVYLPSLPQTAILEARVAAYRANNAALRDENSQLETRSTELEKKLRRVVALCTGVEEENLDGMVGGLVVAVESERGEEVEVGRVREFLRRVEEVEG